MKKRFKVLVEEIIRREFTVFAEDEEQAANMANSPECYITKKYNRDVIYVKQEDLK